VGDALASTTALGDWYGHVFTTRGIRLVVFVSEASRLVVIISPIKTQKPLSNLERFFFERGLVE